MAEVHTPLRDIANTTPARAARSSASARKTNDEVVAASSPAAQCSAPTESNDDDDGAKRAASVEIDAIILAFERAGAFSVASPCRTSNANAAEVSVCVLSTPAPRTPVD
jgi:hypothetical protein